jgi:heme exporter protein D
MIPDLGKYQTEVLSAYAVSIALIVVLVVVSVVRARKARTILEDVEQRGQKNG